MVNWNCVSAFNEDKYKMYDKDCQYLNIETIPNIFNMHRFMA